MLFGEEKAEKLRYQREWFEWAESENVAGMAMALEEGQKIDEIVLDGLTAGSICALGGRMRLLDFLRENGFDFQTFDGHKRTPLMCSAEAGTLKIASKLLSRGDPQKSVAFSNEDGMNALHFAAKYGNAELVHFLISKGGNPDAADNEGNTALHWSMVGGSPQAVTALLQAGASTSAENKDGKTPDKMKGGKAACRSALEKGGSSFGGSMFGSGSPFTTPHTSAASGSASSSASSGSSYGYGSTSAPDPLTLGEALSEAIGEKSIEQESEGETLFSGSPTLAHERLFTQAIEAFEQGNESEAGEILSKIVEDNVNPFVFPDTPAASIFHALARAAIISKSHEDLESLTDALDLLAENDIMFSLEEIVDSRGNSPYGLAIAANDGELLQALLELPSTSVTHGLLASLESSAKAAGANSCEQAISDWRSNGPIDPDEDALPGAASAPGDSYASGEWSDFLSEKVADAISQRSDHSLSNLIADMAAEEVDVARAKDPDGKTLIHYLAESGKLKFLEDLDLFDEAGKGGLVLASPIDSLRDAKGASPYDIACRRDNSKLLAALLEIEPLASRGEALVNTLCAKADEFSARNCRALLEAQHGATPAPSVPKSSAPKP